MSDKKIGAIDEDQLSTDESSTRDKLLDSIDQLTQVLDMLGRLTQRMHYQVEVMPESSEQKTRGIVNTEKIEKEVSIH